MKTENGLPHKIRLRWIVRLIGLLLLGLSLAYVTHEISTHWSDLVLWRPDTPKILKLAALALVYGSMLYILAEVWHRLIAIFGPEPRSRTWRSYALTQIARYLPGNLLHLIGRAVVLRGGLLDTRQIGVATGIELIIVPAGAMTALLGAVLCIPNSTEIIGALGLPLSMRTLTAIGGIGLVFAIVSMILVGHRFASGRAVLAPLLVALPLCTFFMVCLGAVFGAIAGIVSGAPFLVSAVAGVLAWLIGYVTPGAPGGIGTREATLIFLLSGVTNPNDLIISVILFRLITIFGDLICFSVGGAFLKNVPVR